MDLLTLRHHQAWHQCREYTYIQCIRLRCSDSGDVSNSSWVEAVLQSANYTSDCSLIFTAQSWEWLTSSHLTLVKKTNKLREGRLEKGQQFSFFSLHSLYQLPGKAQWRHSCKHTRSKRYCTLSRMTVFINKSCCRTLQPACTGRQLQAGAPMFLSL